jgi:hypothetical protein
VALGDGKVVHQVRPAHCRTSVTSKAQHQHQNYRVTASDHRHHNINIRPEVQSVAPLSSPEIEPPQDTTSSSDHRS